MNLINLYPIRSKEEMHIGQLWTWKRFNERFVFLIKRADWNSALTGDSNQVVCPVNRFEVVKMTTTGMDVWFGVVTSISTKRKFRWRTDYSVRVKNFENILDAIEYSEKKRANYDKRRIQAEKKGHNS